MPENLKIIKTPAELAAIGRDWDKLHKRIESTNPFSMFAHTWAWYDIWGEGQGDELHIVAISDENDCLRAIFPLVISSFGISQVRPFRALRTAGRIISQPQGIVMEMPPILVTPGWEESTLRALHEIVNRSATHHYWVDITGLSENLVNLWQRVDSNILFENYNFYYLLHLPGTWNELRDRLSRNTREAIRKSTNTLNKRYSRIEFDFIKGWPQLAQPIEVFLKLHKARANMTGVVSHPHYYPTREHEDYLRTLARELPEGEIQLALLKIDSSIVAARIIYVANGHYYLYSSGFEPKFWHDGVMRRLTVEIIKEAIENKFVNAVNLSVGGDYNKHSWGSEGRGLFRTRIVPTNLEAKVGHYLAQRWADIRGRKIDF